MACGGAPGGCAPKIMIRTLQAHAADDYMWVLECRGLQHWPRQEHGLFLRFWTDRVSLHHPE
eukprot:1158521-Pelagomonas_calceolata.AAC.2